MQLRTERWTSGLTGALLLLLGTGWPLAAVAQVPFIYIVDTELDDAALDDCSLVTPDDCSLRGAIHKANTDGLDSQIRIPDGVYQLTLAGPEDDLGLVGDLDVYETGKALTISAASGAHPIIEQTASARVMDLRSGPSQVTLRGPMILRYAGPGAFAGFGGVLYVQSQNVELDAVALIDGVATDSGGCLFATDVGLTGPVDWNWTGMIVDGCASGNNGGGANVSLEGGEVVMDGVEITENSAAESAGGMRIRSTSGGSVDLVRSIVRGNASGTALGESGIGGGLQLITGGAAPNTGTITVRQSEISENRAGNSSSGNGYGGGIASTGSGLVTVRNTTISHNLIEGSFNRGVGLRAEGHTELFFVTIVEPAASHAASEAALDGGASSQLIVEGSVFVGGCSSSGGASGTTNREVLPSDTPPGGPTWSGCTISAQVVADAGLQPLASYGSSRRTHRPEADSPLINGSWYTHCPQKDQRDAARPLLFLAYCDLGAHERLDYGVPPGPVVFGDGFESGDALAWQP
ncbi:MAG: hypothetical protein DWQ30_08755 [Acidobacteria bacterium]|nr:MAG: hypothetical protein DWQ30_08755 [Acidobacteriota bacterium]